MAKSEYGSYTAFAGIAALLASLIGTGINNAMVRFSADHLSRTGERPYTLYLLSLVVEVSLYLIVLSGTLLFPGRIATLLLGKPQFRVVIPVGALFGLGHLLLANGRSILEAEERFDRYIWTLWFQNGSAFLAVGALWMCQALVFRRVAWILTLIRVLTGGAVVFYGIAGMGTSDWQSRLEREKRLAYDFLSASGWLVAYFVVLAAFSRMDVFMLSRFASEEELANYGVAFRYYSLALLMLSSIGAVLRPKFSRVHMQDYARQWRFLIEWLKHSVWVAVPISLFAFLGKPVFVYINGTQYASSFRIFVVLSVGVWLSLMFSPLNNILVSREEFSHLLALAVVAFVVSLVGNYLLVPRSGGFGAAFGTVLPHAIINVGGFVLIVRSHVRFANEARRV